MIKSNLGSGYVRNVVFDQFIARGTAYGLDINQYWSSQTPGTGAGVELSNITFSVCFITWTAHSIAHYERNRTGTAMS